MAYVIVAWLADPANADGTQGGAELTQSEFRAAKPEGVEVIPVRPESLDLIRDCDVVCVHNCVSYPAETVRALTGKKVVRYFNDLAPHGDKDLTRWLVQNARCIFTSELHRDRFPYKPEGEPRFIFPELVPPPVDQEPFRKASESAQERAGAVALGPWMNYGKAPHLAKEAFPEIDFYGGGPCKPVGSEQIAYADVPKLLARYETYVHLPTALEPFGRGLVEAYAAGLEIVTNSLVGSRWWLENDPEKLDSAAEDYWSLVCETSP